MHVHTHSYTDKSNRTRNEREQDFIFFFKVSIVGFLLHLSDWERGYITLDLSSKSVVVMLKFTGNEMR